MGQRCSGQKQSPQLGLSSSACPGDDDEDDGDDDDDDDSDNDDGDDDDDDNDCDDDDDNAPGRAPQLFSLPLVWNKPDLILMMIMKAIMMMKIMKAIIMMKAITMIKANHDNQQCSWNVGKDYDEYNDPDWYDNYSQQCWL